MTTKILLAAAVAASLVLTACESDGAPTSADPTTPSSDRTELSTTGADAGDGTATDGTEASSSLPTSDDNTAPSTTEPRPDAVVDVDIQPGQATDEFVGARKDVTVDRCNRRDDEWVAAGTVTNTSGGAATYRIYVAFNVADTADTRGLVQVDVQVADGATEEWGATVPVPEDGLTCILRVERVAAE